MRFKLVDKVSPGSYTFSDGNKSLCVDIDDEGRFDIAPKDIPKAVELCVTQLARPS